MNNYCLLIYIYIFISKYKHDGLPIIYIYNIYQITFSYVLYLHIYILNSITAEVIIPHPSQRYYLSCSL